MSAVMVSMAVLIRTFSSRILAGRGGTYRAPVRYVTKTWSVVLLDKIYIYIYIYIHIYTAISSALFMTSC